jgi:hypothetical protein
MTERLPGWPWAAALPRRVDWRENIPKPSRVLPDRKAVKDVPK